MNVPDDIKQWRKARRAELLARRLAVAPAQRRQWNDAITQWLLAGFPLLQWMVVGSYWPFQGEFDPRYALRRWRESGARAALPEVTQKGMPLQFRAWWPGVPMISGVFGLPVPQATALLRPQALLIPPLGFDAHGYRLGYGGGYFDRTLAALDPQPLKIGVAFELSRMETIHPQPHDVPMDFIVTEAGIHRVSETGLARIDDPRAAAEHAGRIILERERASTPAAASADEPGQYASPACYAHELDPAYRDG